MADAALRWGVLGSGKIARDFACSMNAVPGSRIVSVASRQDSEQLSEFAADFACRSYGSYEAMAADAEVDIVYVATIHPTHFALAKMSLEAGKHCLVEKPFTMNRREAAELAGLAAARGLFLMEAMWTRFLPATVEALRLVGEGAIGELRSGTSSVGGGGAPAPPLEEQQWANSTGAGSLLNVGVYNISVPMFFFRQEHPSAAVDGAGSIVVRSTGSVNEGGSDTSGVHVVDYGAAGRTIAHCSSEYTLPNEVVLYGSAGSMRLNSAWGPSSIELNGEAREVPFEPPSPLSKGKWSAPNDGTTWRSGMAHEIIECQNCIAAGRAESELWPLSATLCVMGLMDDARRQLGVSYPSDEASVVLRNSASL